MFGWGGIPVIWSGDEQAAPNDPSWAEEPGHGQDNRWAHRPRLDRALTGDTPDTRAARMYDGLRHLAAVRASLPHLHASVAAQVLDPGPDAGVLAVLRRHPQGDLLELFNVTGRAASWPADRIPAADLTDALTGAPPDIEDGAVRLAPYQARWLVGPAP